MSKGPGKSSSNKIIHNDKQEVAPGKKNCESCLPKKTSLNSSLSSSPVYTVNR